MQTLKYQIILHYREDLALLNLSELRIMRGQSVDSTNIIPPSSTASSLPFLKVVTAKFKKPQCVVALSFVNVEDKKV